MKKWYRNLMISIAVIPAIIYFVLTILRTVQLPPQPAEENYNSLKDYCMQIVSGTSIEEIEKNEVKATKVIKESFLEIEVKTKECKVIAQYPINKDSIIIENGRVCFNIEHSESTYFNESLISTKFEMILSGIASSGIWICAVLILFLSMPIEYKKCQEEEKKMKLKK